MTIKSVGRPGLLLFAFLFFLLPAPAAAQFGDFTFFEPSPLFVPRAASNARLEEEFFQMINRTRVERGLKPLEWSNDIAEIAREHSSNMAFSNFFGHRDRAGRFIDDRADAHGLKKWRMIGENIAYCAGYDNPVSTTLNAWLESAGHRKNLLRKKWRETGIGVAISPGGRIYVTQVFLKR